MKKIELTNQVHISYARTTDAVEAIKLAISNGQTRLAMEMLPDILDGLVAALEDAPQDKEIPDTSLSDVLSATTKNSSETKASTPKQSVKQSQNKQVSTPPVEDESTTSK